MDKEENSKELGLDITAMSMLTSSNRKPNDINLMEIVRLHLVEYISDEAAKMLMDDPSMVGVYELPSAQQRLFINRWLMRALLIFRNNCGINVTNTVIMLSNEGYIEDWVKIFKMIILPFLVNNSILGVPKVALATK